MRSLLRFSGVAVATVLLGSTALANDELIKCSRTPMTG